MFGEKEIAGLIRLTDTDKDELKEELLSYLVENDVPMTPLQKNTAYQLARGHFSENILSQVLKIIHDSNAPFAQKLVQKYQPLIIEPEMRGEERNMIPMLVELAESERDELQEELLSFIIENDVRMTPSEKNAAYQFARGHYSENILTQVLQIIRNTDQTFITKVAEKYSTLIKPIPKPAFKFEPSKIVPEEVLQISAEVPTEQLFAGDLVTDLMKLAQEDRDELQEELLTYLIEKNVKLNSPQRALLNQFAKGNYTPNLLSQTLEIVNHWEPTFLTRLAEKYVPVIPQLDTTATVGGLVGEFMRLSQEDRDELKDLLFSHLVENETKLNPQERAIFTQFVKGNYTTNLLSQVIQVVNHVDPKLLSKLNERYLSTAIKPEVPALSDTRVFDLARLAALDHDELKDTILSYLVENDVLLSIQEKNLLGQFARGHSSKNSIQNVFQIITKVDPQFTTHLLDKYHPLVMTPEVSMPPAKLTDLSMADRDELKDELLSFITENGPDLSANEKGILTQFARGHFSENILSQVFKIGTKIDQSFVVSLRERYQKLVKPVLEKDVRIDPLDYPPTPELRATEPLNLFEGQLVADLMKLAPEDREDLQEELLTRIVELDQKLTAQERSLLGQFAKGNYTSNILSQVLQVVNTMEPNFIDGISKKYLKPSFELDMKFGSPKEITANLSNNILNRTQHLNKTIIQNLVDDLLSILSNDELKALKLTQRERGDIYQLIKGHQNPAAVLNALEVGIKILEANRFQIPGLKKLKATKFGVELIPTVGLDNIVEFGRKLEIAGIDNLWITDQYTNMDPYITLTMMAKATNSADLGIGLNNAHLVHPASTASAIASLDIFSNNRVVLELGAETPSQFPSINDNRSTTLDNMYETVQTFRDLWTESKAELSVQPERNIPIYIRAQDRKMLTLAGEIGDGILVNYSNETDLKMATKEISEGVKKKNKSLHDIDLAAYTCFSINADEKLAMKATIPIVAFLVAGASPNTLERHDLNVQIANKIKTHLSRGEIANAFRLVDTKFIDVFSISGTAQQVLNKIETLRGAGMTQVIFGSPLGPQKTQAIDLITQSILPSYK